MAWNKGKVEKAWRIFDKAMGVIAEALDVPTDELKALILEGTVPPYDRSEPVWIDETPPAPTPEAIEVLTKRATLADLAPPAPAVVLDQAAPIVDEPISFTTSPPLGTMSPKAREAITAIAEAAVKHIRSETPLAFRPDPKRPAYVAPVSQPAPNAVPAVDMLIGESLEDRPMPPRRSNVPTDAENRRRAHKPVEFHLMHKGKYLHESCTGLTDDKARAWRQPESKLAAVRRKFPETVDYIEVIA